MKFDDAFEIEDVTAEEVWLALSDPVMVGSALTECRFLVPIEEENPDFEELKRRAAAANEDPPTLPEADPETILDRAFDEGDLYAASVEVGVGSVKSSFETVVTITERSFPTMKASGEGSSSNSSFEMNSAMTIVETGDGVVVEWEVETDIFGRIAQIGQRMINPVANRVINRFFNRIADQLHDVGDQSTDLRDRIQGLI